MLVIIKERGDVREKMGILQIDDEYKEITIVQHPKLEEGDTHHISMLNHLIKSVRKD